MATRKTKKKAESTTPSFWADPLATLEGISAQLVGLHPEDKDELQAIQEKLLRLADLADLAGGTIEHLAVVDGQLQAVLNEQASDGASALAEASKALGEAVDFQEASQPDETDELDEPVEMPEKAPTASKIEFTGPAVMSEGTDVNLLGEYIVESLDHISNAEGALLELESNPEDREQIDVVFRAFHTIKGTSGFLGLDHIQKCAHLAENLLDRARENQVRIKGDYADLLLRSCDCLRTMIEELRGVQPGEKLPVPDDLTECLKILSDPVAAGYGEDATEEEPMRLGDILVGKNKISRKTIEEIEKSKDNRKIGKALIDAGVASPAEIAEAIRTQQAQKQGRSQTAIGEGSVRVATGRLDNLINMVGELVIAQSMVAQDPEVINVTAGQLHRNVTHAGKIIRELQDLTLSLRMVPLKGIFQKMNRMVRDLGQKSGKKVQFITEGEDTEIDRNIVESLNDPLVHMIRNSMDHGLESAEDRRRAGKDPTGTVTLRAYHAAGNVVIELWDDGRGLDREKIINKAVEKGIIESGHDLADNDAFMLILEPGFSTVEEITDISGRGVGMDVVKQNIKSLHGHIEVASRPGEGTTFTVRLPLTMAIADAMILRIGQGRYLLPVISIEHSFRPTPQAVSTVNGRGEMVMFRNELLPVFRLHKLFNIEGAVVDPCEGLLIVIESDGQRCALMVDELLDQQQVVIKSLGPGMAEAPGISGGAILGDGQVSLILDARGILQLAESGASLIGAAAELDRVGA